MGYLRPSFYLGLLRKPAENHIGETSKRQGPGIGQCVNSSPSIIVYERVGLGHSTAVLLAPHQVSLLAAGIPRTA